MSHCKVRSDCSAAQAVQPCWRVQPAVRALDQGRLIAYPTEAVWGLGCDPLDPLAVRQLLELKRRPESKGLILVAADLDQLRGYLGPVTRSQREQLQTSWPGPVTWLCPVGPKVPDWIRGAHDRVALRVSANPVVHALCTAFGRPLVSTSANRAGQLPAGSALNVRHLFGPELGSVVAGYCGGADRPTQIRDLLTGAILRD